MTRSANQIILEHLAAIEAMYAPFLESSTPINRAVVDKVKLATVELLVETNRRLNELEAE